MIVLEILKAFPGIAEEENITKSFGCNFICLCVPLAILDKAESGSPCVPVQSKHTLFGAKELASSGVTNISLFLIAYKYLKYSLSSSFKHNISLLNKMLFVWDNAFSLSSLFV